VLLTNDVTIIVCITEIPYAYTPYKDHAKSVSKQVIVFIGTAQVFLSNQIKYICDTKKQNVT